MTTSERVQALRDAFDRTFAEAPTGGTQRGAVALAIRIGDDAYALPLAPHVGSVVKAPRIVPLPGGGTHQLGVAGVRGALAIVFSLAELLGYARSSEAAWLATLTGNASAALAFDGIEGQIDLAAHSFAQGTTTGVRRHVAGVIGTSPPRALIDIPSILERL